MIKMTPSATKKIYNLIYKEHGVTETQIKCRRRCREYVEARCSFIWIAHLLGYSSAEIGRAINRDHSTILHHLRARLDTEDLLNYVLQSFLFKEKEPVMNEPLLPNPADALRQVLKFQGNTLELDNKSFKEWHAYCEQRGYEMMPHIKPFSQLVDLVQWTAQCGEAYVVIKGGSVRIFVDIVDKP